MFTTNANYAKGLVITAIGGLALTVDIPLILLADGDPWSIVMLRSGTTFLASIAIWLIWALVRKNPPTLIPGRAGLLVAALYGTASVTFVMAVFHTSTANLVFILAFNTVFASLLGWLFLGERPRTATMVAMAFMLGGVSIIVLDGLGRGSIVGDLFAVASSILLASAITVTRASAKDMGFAALMAFALPALLGVVMVSQVGFRVEQPLWVLLTGIIVLPLSFFCLATGPKYISGPEVAMFYLLETVLTPVWVWMIFAEVPTTASLIGGTILVVTLIAHSVWALISARQAPTRQDEPISETHV